MKIALIQYNPVWEDKERNKKTISRLIEENFSEEKILILPELTLTGFTMNSKKFAEPLTGSSALFYSALSKKIKADLFAGLIELHEEKYFNSLLHFNPEGKLISVYRKIHPFTFSTEDKHYSAGETPVTTQVDDLKIGLSICYDLRFPELFRRYGKERVDLLINIANWPDTRIEHWRVLLKARAIENQCYVAGVNRVGADIKLNYNGFSSLFDPMGNEIVSIKDEEIFITAEINKNIVDETRRQLPFLEDIKLI
jgi:omega-amidase